jgi:glutamate synthase domain-containing protein 3
VKLFLAIRNCHRAVGATLSSEVSRRYGSKGLSPDTISVKFTGSAGQSFGAFLAPGISFELEGEANDYFAKGLSGGRIVVYPPRAATFRPQDNIITGNVSLFGATGGEVFVNGMAGERFAVRNSGAVAVVEGVGDHGCEYMTGGVVVVLGRTGVNFAAGMSGGIAFVYDEDGTFPAHCNTGMVDVKPLHQASMPELRMMLDKHYKYTESAVARRILDTWRVSRDKFVRVMPRDYARVFREQQKGSALQETVRVAR